MQGGLRGPPLLLPPHKTASAAAASERGAVFLLLLSALRVGGALLSCTRPRHARGLSVTRCNRFPPSAIARCRTQPRAPAPSNVLATTVLGQPHPSPQLPSAPPCCGWQVCPTRRAAATRPCLTTASSTSRVSAAPRCLRRPATPTARPCRSRPLWPLPISSARKTVPLARPKSMCWGSRGGSAAQRLSSFRRRFHTLLTPSTPPPHFYLLSPFQVAAQDWRRGDTCCAGHLQRT